MYILREKGLLDETVKQWQVRNLKTQRALSNICSVSWNRQQKRYE